MAVDIGAIKRKYEEMKKKQEQQSSGFNFMEIIEGKNPVRVLSSEEEGVSFYVEGGYHYLRMEGEKTKAIVCLQQTYGKACYLCELVSELYKTKEKKDETMAKQIKASKRYFMNVIDRKDNAVKTLAIGPQAFGGILAILADEDWGDITDRETGHDIEIVKTKTGSKATDVTYSVMPKPKPTAVGVDNIVLYDLDKILEPVTYEQQEAIFNGDSIQLDEAEEPQPAETTKQPEPAKKAGPKRKPVVEEPSEIDVLTGKLDLTNPAVAKVYNKWKVKDGSVAGLKAVVEMFADEEAEAAESTSEASSEAGQPEGEDELDRQIKAAMDKFKKAKK